MNPISIADDTIVQEVIINTPAARIFRALTCPSELLKWWACEGKFQLVEAECDLRPGGKWRMRVAGSCGPGQSDSIVTGEYRSIDPPRLLEFTWKREREHHPETLVRWDLEEKNGLTTVRITHSGLITEALRTRNGGWPLIASLLKVYVEQRH